MIDRLTLAPPALSSDKGPALSLRPIDGGPAFILRGRILLGSHTKCDVVVEDSTVSRVHAEIAVEQDGVWIKDLDSRNGTFVEEVRVREAALAAGMRVRLAGATFTVEASQVSQTRSSLWPEPRFGALLGQSDPMRRLFAQMNRIAPTQLSVLILGESGTGKELIARELHNHSLRAKAPYVVVDCATLSTSLLDAALFGHTRGAFTGAVEARAGAFEVASGGTVFLDEIGELTLDVQPRLLRVLERREVVRIGEVRPRAVDVRFIAATHRNIPEMVARGAFREDLYFRLAGMVLDVPPLRARRDDILPLVESFLGENRGLASRAWLASLEDRPWIGNIRELRNTIDRAVALGFRVEPEESSFGLEARTAQHLLLPEPAPMLPAPAPVPKLPTTSPSKSSGPPLRLPRTDTLESSWLNRDFKDFRQAWLSMGERLFLAAQLQKHGNNVSATARTIGVARNYLHKLLARHGFERTSRLVTRE